MINPLKTHLSDHTEPVVELAAAALTAARDRIAPLAEQTREHLVPFALDAKDRLVPLAVDAKDRLVPLVHEAAAKARPVVTTAVTRVTEVVDTEVKPRVSEFLEEAQAEPHVAVATKRGRAAMAALKGDLAMPAAGAAKAAKRCHPVLKTLGVLMIAAGIAYLIKTLLGERDDDWELVDEPAEDDMPAESPIAEPAPAPARAAFTAPAPAGYGEGAYVGDNPPEGYDIKGNADSMKYHVPGALAYSRCIPEVWFNSPEAAEAAGFTRAAR